MNRATTAGAFAHVGRRDGIGDARLGSGQLVHRAGTATDGSAIKPKYAWSMIDPVLWPAPVPAKGAQGFWEWPHPLPARATDAGAA